MSSPTEIIRLVEVRAGQRCEYCRMHQALQGAMFHVEHIRPSSQGGSSEVDNLAWACPSCNLHKADRTLIADPDSNQMVSLFHPRQGR
jgi:predicted restriction endonuclease